MTMSLRIVLIVVALSITVAGNWTPNIVISINCISNKRQTQTTSESDKSSGFESVEHTLKWGVC